MAASSAWVMRRAVRIVRIQPDCGRARLRALRGASCLSMRVRSLRCAGGAGGVVGGSALSMAIGGVLGCGEMLMLSVGGERVPLIRF